MTNIEFVLCLDIFKLEIQITILSVIILHKELRLHIAIYFSKFTDVVIVDYSNDYFIYAFW